MLLVGLEVFADPEQCRGEYYSRLGLIEKARARASSSSKRFSELGIRKIITFCPACHNTIANLSPRLSAVSFNLQVVDLADWLLH